LALHNALLYFLAKDRMPISAKPAGDAVIVFPEHSQEQELRFDIRTSELTGFVACEEDDSARFFRVSLEHLVCLPPWRLGIPRLLW